MPLNHAQVWRALDRLAAARGLTPSGLARRAGLDPTSFNPSKRQSAGRLRWPSTESLGAALSAAGASLAEFAALAEDDAQEALGLPVIGFAQAGDDGFFDDGGFPVGEGWDRMAFPGSPREGLFALRVQGDSMQPAYREGDRLVVDRAADIRRGDRVVVCTAAGEVMAKELKRRTADRLELKSLNPAYADRTLPLGEVSWIGRILWASQ